MSRTLNFALQQEERIVVTQNFGWRKEEGEGEREVKGFRRNQCQDFAALARIGMAALAYGGRGLNLAITGLWASLQVITFRPFSQTATSHLPRQLSCGDQHTQWPTLGISSK